LNCLKAEKEEENEK